MLLVKHAWRYRDTQPAHLALLILYSYELMLYSYFT
jgi:hypothetical protein